MYIEYTPFDLFDEAEQHLRYPAAAGTTTFGFGVSVGGSGVADDNYDDGENGIDDDEISIVQNGNGFFELKSHRRPTKRKCSELPPAQKSTKNIKRNFIGSSGTQNHSYSHNSGGGTTSTSSIPMGFDFFSRIRKLFSDSDGPFGRKRRADDGDWNSAASQFKYRRVDNGFPKIVKKSFEEGMVWRPYPREDEIKIVPQRLHKSPLVMAQQNQKEKRSHFVRPKTVTKHITNTNFADIEFSDDDDAEFIFTNSRGEAFNIVAPPSASSIRPVLSRANLMPSMSSASIKMQNIPFKQRQPPPPLIQASTGNILASTLMPNLQPICQQRTYSSILSACTNGFDDRDNTNVASKRSTNKETVQQQHQHRTTSPFFFNGTSATANINNFTSLKGARSIMARENVTKDQEQYRELLNKLIPNLYGIQGTSPKSLSLPLNKSRLSINRTKEPVTIDCTTENSSTPATRNHHRKVSIGENALTFELSDDEDDEVCEIIDLAEEELNMLSACSKLQDDQAECQYDVKKRAAEKKKQLPFVEPVNSLKEKFDLSPVCQNDWLENFHKKWQKKHLEGKQKIAETEKEVEELSAETRDKEKEMQDRLKELQIVDPDLIIVDDFPEGEEEPEFPAITPEHEAIIKGALFGGPPDQMLISKFNMSITRRDISTLFGKTWLNDEVINFYMNLLTERGENRNEEGLPKVYAMNTFFVPRLLQSGHSGVRRWTRKVDIFTYDVLPVPVHVGGIHWCMAIIHLRDRTIKYYDSMGTPNPKILAALEQYLREESLDKRKRPFDTSGFLIESVRDVPQQNNGSDCGVFSCMFAEFICRDREITFSQQNMEYFRHKMILEIVQGQLMQ
ncbi:sentrin-specific protease 1 isoform X2 [Eupeodes corollae]|uniref:sentrin-specific protease 1 isoform X2 n=1 Tax=Eupeodes corollae TaxID=290404 RepID=UPI002490C922|nr:sentrin-specific protease 1 isoform X2 [Eupeodes corollae]